MGRFTDTFGSAIASSWSEKSSEWLIKMASLPANTNILSSEDLALITELTTDYLVPLILLDEGPFSERTHAERCVREANEAKKAITSILFSALTQANPQHSMSKDTFSNAFNAFYETLFFGIMDDSEDRKVLLLFAELKKQPRSQTSLDQIERQLDALNKDLDFTLTDDFSRALILLNEFRICADLMFRFAKSLNPTKHYSDSDLLRYIATLNFKEKTMFYLKVFEHPFCNATVVGALLKNPHCSADCKKRCNDAIHFRENILRRIDIECRDVRAANYAIGFGNALQVEDKLRDAVSKCGTVAQIEKLITDYCERRPYMSLASHLLGVIELKPAALAPG